MALPPILFTLRVTIRKRAAGSEEGAGVLLGANVGDSVGEAVGAKEGLGVIWPTAYDGANVG